MRASGSGNLKRAASNTYRLLIINSAGATILVINTATASSPMPALYSARDAPRIVVVSWRPWISSVRKVKLLDSSSRMKAVIYSAIGRFSPPAGYLSSFAPQTRQLADCPGRKAGSSCRASHS